MTTRLLGAGALDLTSCPECGAAAEVQWRLVMESSDGPVEHVRVLCVHRHWFLLPAVTTGALARSSGAER
ncbi:hypothetical protein [Jiangella alkaliphila]|uniref:Uncharacterized protein n=1 Tax=Jiangella alkaliphila TaxID=419479 RepID=A0A1H2KK80_9ACTN|nr:hypothetical protein [Jiangella alkaliphila]SDU69069.1 hypothetical protein SAMN04488563_3931 [Jiangella alkaliphila]